MSTLCDPRRDYLDLLARAVSNYLYLGGQLDEASYPDRRAQYDDTSGWRIPETARPHTGARLAQLESLHRLVVRIIERGTPGDFLEAGVWQGGVVIFIAGILRAYGITQARVWALDTFSGIPAGPHPADVVDPVDEWTDRWVAPIERVCHNVRRYGPLGESVRLLPGRFRNVVPGSGIEQLALLRIDADSYASTREALELLYPKVSRNGFVIVDDWHLEGCRRAVLDYRRERNIRAPLQGVHATGNGADEDPYEVFWTA